MPTLLDDDTIAFGEEDNINQDKLTHPYVTFFHLAFRSSALLVYLLGKFFSDSFIGLFVTVVLLLSCDFWTVKNITGRLMVGLRWWNYIDDEGKSHWVFESRKGDLQNRINAYEAKIFWFALIGVSLAWTLFFIGALITFSFKWLLLICIALILNYANFYGYVKCRMGGQGSTDNQNIGITISAMTSDFIKKQVLNNMANIGSRTPISPSAPPTSVV